MCAQPAAGHQPGVLPRQLNPRVEGTQRAGVQQGRHPVEHGEQAGAVAGDDVPAHQGSDVLGRLQPAIVGQDDQMPRGDVRIGGEQQRDADVPRLQGLQGQRAPGVERDERLEAQPVDPFSPGRQ